MSLLRLLSAGKSWVGSNDSATRYQMGDPRAMPRFGSAKNPFAKKQAEQPPTAAPERETPIVTPPAERPKPAPVSREPRRPLLGPWIKSCLGWMRRKQPKSQPLIPQLAKRPVQGELSLERVKVVRNDLSDTDLEIVTAKAGSRSPSEPRPSEPLAVAARETECAGAAKS